MLFRVRFTRAIIIVISSIRVHVRAGQRHRNFPKQSFHVIPGFRARLDENGASVAAVRTTALAMTTAITNDK